MNKHSSLGAECTWPLPRTAAAAVPRKAAAAVPRRLGRRRGVWRAWPREQRRAVGCFVGVAVAQSCLEPLLRSEGFDAVIPAFWSGWLLVLALAARLLLMDPRDPGGPAATVKCSQCQVPVQRDTKHCWTCKECIVGFDHHCQFLNLCIGSRNYSVFAWLIGSVLYVLLVFTTDSLLVGMRADRLLLRAAAFSLAAAGAAGSFVVGKLVVLHCRLAFEGVTTYEYLRGGQKPSPPGGTALTLEEKRAWGVEYVAIGALDLGPAGKPHVSDSVTAATSCDGDVAKAFPGWPSLLKFVVQPQLASEDCASPKRSFGASRFLLNRAKRARVS